MQVVVLASGSQYRAQLLARLGLEFQTLSPEIDESPLARESPAELAKRLARCKAETVANMTNEPSGHDTRSLTGSATRIIIASDQVACVSNTILGKPGTLEKACAQLTEMSGQRVEFLTSLYMLEPQSGEHFYALDVTRVQMRHLDESTITRYVAAENPVDCAGSFKVESLGISLFDSVNTDDPTALIGLPLIKVCEGLRTFGMHIP